MRESLIIFMQGQAPGWVLMDANGEAIQQVATGDPAVLATLAENREVFVIVPAADVLLTSVKMPHMSRARLQQALPFALEDQLVSEVDTLHFVAGTPDAQDQLPVAVVAKVKMEAWLAQLKEWQVVPDVLIPSIFALPVADNAWHMLLDDALVVRTKAWHGFCCDSADDWLSIALHSAENKPTSITVWQSSTKALPVCEIPLNQHHFTPEALMVAMSTQALQTPHINLLQGLFQNKKVRYPQKRKMLKLAMGLTAAWVALLLLNPVVSWFLLNQRVSSLDGEIKQIYLRHFPSATSLVAPRLRMEEKLRQSTSQENEIKFFVLLHALSKALKTQAGITLKRLDYQNNQLVMQVTATSSENFAHFADALIQQGWQVKQQNANLAGENVNATIVMQ